jgi:hypothetical protein
MEVDQLSVDQLSVDQLSVDQLSVDQLRWSHLHKEPIENVVVVNAEVAEMAPDVLNAVQLIIHLFLISEAFIFLINTQ